MIREMGKVRAWWLFREAIRRKAKGMRETYDKLVRDRIPEIIREPGKVCQVVTMAEPEFL